MDQHCHACPQIALALSDLLSGIGERSHSIPANVRAAALPSAGLDVPSGG